VALLVGLGAVASAQQAVAPAGPVNLLEGLRDGTLFAQFRGAGASGVSGVIGGPGLGAQQVQIPSGTQFQAQLPGRQGMSALGSLNIDLGEQRLAQVMIPAACTNLGLPEPTPDDVMIPRPCPDARLARLAAVLDLRPTPQPVAQVAVWAISDNPPATMLQPYLLEQAPGFDLAAYAQRRAILQQAAQLLGAAGLEVGAFRMFLGMRQR
jgi:hypothetical protein